MLQTSEWSSNAKNGLLAIQLYHFLITFCLRRHVSVRTLIVADCIFITADRQSLCLGRKSFFCSYSSWQMSTPVCPIRAKWHFFIHCLSVSLCFRGEDALCAVVSLLMISCAVPQSFPHRRVHFIMTLIAFDVFEARLKVVIKHIKDQAQFQCARLTKSKK